MSEERKDIVSLGAYLASMLDPTLHWKDVDWLRGIWRGPLLLKGVLHPIEARLAVEHGIDGVIVSNHGGRQLDTALPAIRALPAVVDAVAGRVPVLLDGGVRRGSHVVKAVALGAAACLIGRPHLWGLAVAGEAGVAQVLEIFRRDIDRVLALGGWDGIAQVDRGALAPATGALVGGERAEQASDGDASATWRGCHTVIDAARRRAMRRSVGLRPTGPDALQQGRRSGPARCLESETCRHRP